MAADCRHRIPQPVVESRPVTTALGAMLLLLAMLHQPVALAHQLETDGDIGVLMHVDPGDEPVVGEQATFMLDIQDRRGAFLLAGCDCRLRLSLDGGEVFSGQIKDDKSGTLTVQVLFAKPGIYRAEVTGDPLSGTVFQKFRVVFDVRVTPGESSGGSWWLLIACAIAALIVATGLMRKFWKRR